MWETPLKGPINNSYPETDLPIHDTMKYITVSCRLKPLLTFQDKSKIQIDKRTHSITLNDPTKSISKTYSFDEIFDQSISQQLFTKSICQPLVRFLKKGGQSGLIFSYGITNSGKTYTILGTKEKPGILLNLIKSLEEELKGETLRIVACELYKDEFFSLKNKGQRIIPKQLRGTFSFEECHSDIINQNNMEELFNHYLQNRSCSPTTQNTQSSRSHAIFKISTSKFKIGIVDLAGSQRSSKGLDITDIKETIFINSSLLTLKKCIKALEQKSGICQKVCVPYRQSKLTQALMEYFVQNSKIDIIVNINQAKHCLELNLNVMDYTSKAKNITANATSDFSMMLKSTAKKQQELLSALKKHKNAKSNKKIKSPHNTKNLIFKSKGAFSKLNKSLQDEQDLQKSQKSENIGKTLQPYKALDSIDELNDEKKLSENISTTIPSQNEDQSSNILIEELEYEQFNPIKQTNQHKIRYSVQFKDDKHTYIIDEEVIQDQQLTEKLMIQIETQERLSFMSRKSQQLKYKQLIEHHQLIEEFIQKQEKFRNYLAIDREIEAEADERKLSALKKVNLMQTQKKKQTKNDQKLPTKVDCAVQTSFMIRQTSDVNEMLDNLKFQKLRTEVKRKLLRFLDEEKKKMLIDAQTIYTSQKKFLKQQNNQSQIFREAQSDTWNEQQSNYTTPIKKNLKAADSSDSSQDQNEKVSKSLGKNILTKTFEKVASGMKYFANKVGLGNHIFRTNNKSIRHKSEEKTEKNKNEDKRGQLQIWNEISQAIDLTNKITYEIGMNTEVIIVPSSKKVRMLSQKIIPKISADGQIDIDGQLVIEEKQVLIDTCEVGIQTQDVKVKFALHQVIEETIHQQVKKKKQKRGKKNNKDSLEKTPFKNHISVRKNMYVHSISKNMISAQKSVIAKKTRAQLKKADKRFNEFPDLREK